MQLGERGCPVCCVQRGQGDGDGDGDGDTVSPGRGPGRGRIRRYPMRWLLDHALLEMAGTGDGGGGRRWEKVEGADSVWFRVTAEVKAAAAYPVDLENTRYQIHVYRRL